MLDSIQQMVTVNGRLYRGYAPRYVDVLKTLHEIGGVVESKSGLASTELASRCHMRHTRELSRGGFNEVIKKLEQAGWVEAQRGLRRTYRIALLNPLPPDIDDWLESPGQWEASAGVEHDSASTAPVPPADMKRSADEEPSAPLSLVPDWPEASPAPHEDDEREELGMRPGRLAARIERQVPELVRGAVHDELSGMISGVLNSLGWHQGVSAADFEALQQENDTLQSRIAYVLSENERLTAEVERTGAMVDWLQDQADEKLIHSNEGQVATRVSLTVSQLPEQYRRIGAHALAAGWTIRKTRGSHLAWRSPQGKTAFSATTSSDRGSEQIIWRKLRRLGLEDYRGRTQENADEGRWSGAHHAAD